MKILVTGFEPFGSRKTNNSWEIAKGFRNRDEIKVLQLPVSFSQSHCIVMDQIENQSFDIVLMLGETSSTNDYVRLERVAINFKDSINRDNDEVIANEEILVENASPAYFTKFPLKNMACKLRESGYPVKVSNSAGTFVCNSLYFNILHYIETKKLMTKALFIHVPATTQVISLEGMKNTLNEIIKMTLKKECQDL